MPPDYPVLARLLNHVVLADRKSGIQIKARVYELHMEGFYGAYDLITEKRITIYPSEVVEVYDDAGQPMVGDVAPADPYPRPGVPLKVVPPKEATFDSFPLNGLFCSVCTAPQRTTPGGASCINGHGGVEGKTDAYPF